MSECGWNLLETLNFYLIIDFESSSLKIKNIIYPKFDQGRLKPQTSRGLNKVMYKKKMKVIMIKTQLESLNPIFQKIFAILKNHQKAIMNLEEKENTTLGPNAPSKAQSQEDTFNSHSCQVQLQNWYSKDLIYPTEQQTHKSMWQLHMCGEMQ